MDGKQIWTTIIISTIVALIVLFLVSNFFSTQVLAGPPWSATASSTSNTEASSLSVKTVPLYDLVPRQFAGGGGYGQLSNGTIICNIDIFIEVLNRENATAGPSHTEVILYNSFTNQHRTLDTPKIEIGQGVIVRANFTGLSLGEYKILVSADFFNEVRESNENNNIISWIEIIWAP